MRRRTVLAGGAALLVAGSAGSLALVRADPAPPTPAAASTAPTATVERGDLEQTTDLVGTLGHGPSLLLTGRAPGTITWLPSIGTVVARGDQVYRVDDRPVVLFHGDLPLYRTLEVPTPSPPSDPPTDPPPPLRGRDVDLVAANLADLQLWNGRTSGVEYGVRLARAVRDWQRSIGAAPTGVVEPGDVLVTGNAIRVDGLVGTIGGDGLGEVLTWTGTRRVVQLRASAEQAAQVAPEQRIEVRLPDGAEVAAVVTAVGEKAEVVDDGTGTPTVAVTVDAVEPSALDAAPLGPVTATLTLAARDDVLFVPVTALLALAEGGHALEDVDGVLHPVTLGMVAGGRVEVTGVQEGTVVVVAG